MTVLVAAFGSRYRGDDAAGPLVADLLRRRGVEVLDCGDEPTRLVERLDGVALAVLVDAVCSGAPPGTVHRVELTDGVLPQGVRLASSHAFGVADALALASALGRAPQRVVLVGVEGQRFAMGDECSPEVEAALAAAADAVGALVGASL
ncbi:MAG: hydrogenase maturation protease [Gaiella sp.]